MEKKFKFDLGVFVIDNITKVEGIITSRADHITGSDSYGIEPEAGELGYTGGAIWFEEGRLEFK